MKRFCGFPTGVMALPIFEPMAAASRKGTGLRRRWPAWRRTRGVITRQTTSLLKSAENHPPASADATAPTKAAPVRSRRTTGR
jgi:hypothetical protein